MTTTDGQRSAVRSSLWWGGVLLTLAGLFGMHGLGDHGTNAHAVTRDGMSVMHHSAAALGPTASEVSDSVSVAGNGAGGDGMSMGATAMCLAVLLLTLIAALVLARTRRLRPLAVLVPLQARAPARAGRAPDRPDLFGLSIQRC